MRAVFPQMGESRGNHTRTLEGPISNRLLLHEGICVKLHSHEVDYDILVQIFTTPQVNRILQRSRVEITANGKIWFKSTPIQTRRPNTHSRVVPSTQKLTICTGVDFCQHLTARSVLRIARSPRGTHPDQKTAGVRAAEKATGHRCARISGCHVTISKTNGRKGSKPRSKVFTAVCRDPHRRRTVIRGPVSQPPLPPPAPAFDCLWLGSGL